MINKHNNASIIPYSKGGVVVLTSVNLHRNKKKNHIFFSQVKDVFAKETFWQFYRRNVFTKF